MAIHYICDRCGHTTKQRDDLTNIDIEWNAHDYKGARKIKKDLCESCMRGLERYTEPLPKELEK